MTPYTGATQRLDRVLPQWPHRVIALALTVLFLIVISQCSSGWDFALMLTVMALALFTFREVQP